MEINNLKATLSDSEIIDKVLLGETNLYELIVRKYNQQLYRIGRGFFKNNDEEIEDVMQFTYIKAYEKLSTFEKKSTFSTWLIRIFINESLARKKYNQRYFNLPDEEVSDEEYIEEDKMKTPDNITINNELKEVLEKTIDSLPEKYKLVFIMFEIEKLSIKETGESLNITESNVKVRLNRARKMLRDNLSTYYKPDELYHFNAVRCDLIVKNVLTAINKKN